MNAFVSPTLLLFFSLPQVAHLKQKLVRTVFCKPDYVLTKSLDTQFAGDIMLLEIAMVLGASVPVVLPLVCVAFATNLAVFRAARSKLGLRVKHEAKPAFGYLVVSLVLGCTLNVWFFIDNADLVGGSLLVCIGVPASILLGLAA